MNNKPLLAGFWDGWHENRVGKVGYGEKVKQLPPNWQGCIRDLVTETCEETNNFGGDDVKERDVASQKNHRDENHNSGVNQLFVFRESFGFGIIIPGPGGLTEFCFDFVDEGGDFPEHSFGVDVKPG